MSNTKFLMVVMDGLRPDLITPETMPCLAEFRDRWAWFSNARAQYPSVTRVNKVSLATGALPAEHGIWYNGFYDASVFEDREIDLSVMSDVLQADEKYNPLIQVPTIGRYLAGAGLRYAVIHSGTAGASWLLDYRGDRHGHAHYSFAGAYSCIPEGLHGSVEKLLGPQPQPEYPNLPQLEYAFNIFLEIVRPQLSPDVAAIWLNEPDKSLHKDGICGPLATGALKGLDALFRRIHDWWQEHNGKGEEEWQLLVLSDHGHGARYGRIDVVKRIQSAGFEISDTAAGPGAYLKVGYPCAVHRRGSSEAGIADMAAWLQRQEWIGHIFTKSDDPVQGRYPGTFSQRLVGIAGSRLPDLLFSLRADEGPDKNGYAGRFLMPGSEGIDPAGTGHGGLTESEMKTVLIAAGAAFEPDRKIVKPAAISDVLPTILSVYGLSTVPATSGRVLAEALRRESRNVPAGTEGSPEKIYETGDGRDYRQAIRVAVAGGRRYLLQGRTPGFSDA